MWLCLALGAALAGTPDRQYTWTLFMNGQSIGEREATVAIQPDDSRLITTHTDTRFSAGPLTVRYQQRMTAQVTGDDPAAFHTVYDRSGTRGHVKAYWSPLGWTIEVQEADRLRNYTSPLGRIQLSTADLLDPDTHYSLTRFPKVRLLSAETGEVIEGPVVSEGAEVLRIGTTDVHTTKLTVQGESQELKLWYTADGVLVKFRLPMFGRFIDGQLREPPSGGRDDFPVGIGRSHIEVSDL